MANQNEEPLFGNLVGFHDPSFEAVLGQMEVACQTPGFEKAILVIGPAGGMSDGTREIGRKSEGEKIQEGTD